MTRALSFGNDGAAGAASKVTAEARMSRQTAMMRILSWFIVSRSSLDPAGGYWPRLRVLSSLFQGLACPAHMAFLGPPYSDGFIRGRTGKIFLTWGIRNH
jgi:hypothetical protein